MIKVEAPGLFTLVQDRGRPGYYALGFPPSGAMDLYAHDAANILVGNDENAAALEMTFLGGKFTFGQFSVVAVTGAVVDVKLDGQCVPGWMAQIVRKGQTLEIGPTRAGARCYLSVRGGIDVPVVMDSRSTYVSSGLGGHRGRPVEAGDELGIGEMVRWGNDPRGGLDVPESLIPSYSHEYEIRVVPGLCDYRLTEKSVDALYSTPYTVSTEANRTGYRMSGETLDFMERTPPFGAGADPSNVVNLGYPVGSIQAPSGSELIVLLRDAVTGGGYATVGTVIGVDLDVIAQMKAPERVLFQKASVDEALAERQARTRKLQRLIERTWK